MDSKLIIYPEFDCRIERDYLYSVCVTQEGRTRQLPVYNHVEDSRIARNPKNGFAPDEFRRFSTFAFTGATVRVDITVKCDFEYYTVMPSAKSYRNEFHNGVISVWLDEPAYFLIRLDGKDPTILAILADAPEADIPIADDNTVIIEGWQEYPNGVLTLDKPGTTVYIKPGAVLNARVLITANNCRVIGRGAVVDPAGDIYRYDVSKFNSHGVVRVHNADNAYIEGIHLLDSKSYNITSNGIWGESFATGTVVKNIKILSTQMCTDGIGFGYYNRDAYAEHCFIYCGDNCLVYEDGVHYYDMVVGTTCNAVFPQTDVRDSSVDQVYVFRADEGILNHEMGGSDGKTQIYNHKVSRLSAIDVTYAPYFMFLENTEAEVDPTGNGMELEDVWLPPIAKTFIWNSEKGDFKIHIQNLSLAGKPINEVTPDTVNAEVYHGANTFCCTTDPDFVADAPLNQNNVHYRYPQKVFVGACEIHFSNPVILTKSSILLPYEEIRYELRTSQTAEPVEKNGVLYITPEELIWNGMAKAYQKEENAFVLVPNDSDENLLLPDRGIISKYTEYLCYNRRARSRKDPRRLEHCESSS